MHHGFYNTVSTIGSMLTLNRYKLPFIQGGHKPGKHGKPGKLREFENCQNLRENSGKSELFQKKPGKLRENEKHVT